MDNRPSISWTWIVLAMIIASTVIFLSSCSSLRKVKSGEKKSTDSSSVVKKLAVNVSESDSVSKRSVKDSSRINSTSTTSTVTESSFELIKIDSGAIVVYPSGGKIMPDPFAYPMIRNTDGTQHILVPKTKATKTELIQTDQLATRSEESSESTRRRDSAALDSSSDVRVKAASDIKDKSVKRSTFPWLWISIGAVLFLAYRYRRQLRSWLAA